MELKLLKDFIDSLNNGLKTYVGEDGVKLSGVKKREFELQENSIRKTHFLF